MRKTDFEFSSFTTYGGRETRKEILESLRQFSLFIGKKTFTQKEYNNWNRKLLSPKQISDRFGSWNQAMEDAGLVPAWSPPRDVEEMVQIFMDIWEQDNEIPNEKRLGQRLCDLKVTYTVSLYKKYFGGFKRLITKVIKFHNGEITKEELLTRHDGGQDKTYTVYCLQSTRDEIRRYVGETRSTLEKRLAQHHSAAIKKESALYKWMGIEEQDGFEIKIVCLEKDAKYRIAEKKWIAKLLKEGVPPLNGNGKYLHATPAERIDSYS